MPRDRYNPVSLGFLQQLSIADLDHMQETAAATSRPAAGSNGVACKINSGGLTVALTAPRKFMAKITAYDFSQTPAMYAFSEVASQNDGTYKTFVDGVTTTILQAGQKQPWGAYEDNGGFAQVGTIVRMRNEAGEVFRFSYSPPDLFVSPNNLTPVIPGVPNLYDATLYNLAVTGGFPGFKSLGTCWATFYMQVAGNAVPTVGDFYRASFCTGAEYNGSWRPQFFADGPVIIGGGQCVSGGIQLNSW
jgi:hypothetical protein